MIKYSFLAAALLLVLVNSCKKDNDNSDLVTDIDGNLYHTVTIGTQVWMVENLKTTRYNDGTAIPIVTGGSEWSKLSTPGYCWYNNDFATYGTTYGALYNWFTVDPDNPHEIAPAGWHVPSDTDWSVLIDYLGGDSVAGGKLKETGTIYWDSPNTGATNESGFRGLAAGIRNAFDGNFGRGAGAGTYGTCWWSTTNYYTTGNGAWVRVLSNNNTMAGKGWSIKMDGASVRLVRNPV